MFRPFVRPSTFRSRLTATFLVTALLAPPATAQSTGGTTTTPRRPTVPPGSIMKSSAPVFVPGGGGVTDRGDATYEIPLWVPDGPAGIQPALSIRYAGRGNGPLGVGFGLTGLSMIAPCAKSFASEGYAGGIEWDGAVDGDAYCLDGKKLVPYDDPWFELPAGYPTAYHTEIETFEHIVASRPKEAGQQPDEFLVYDRDGGVRTYAAFTAAQHAGKSGEDAPAFTRAVVAQYLLTKRVDRNGNVVRYVYDNDGIGMPIDGAPVELGPRLKSIDYAYMDGTPRRQVRFWYSPRTDLLVRYVRGVRIVSRSLLTKIEAVAPNPSQPSVVWSYHLTYALSPDTGRSLLSTVRMFDQFGAPSWQRSFEWTDREGVSANHTLLADEEFGPKAMGTDADTLRWYRDYEEPWLRANDTRVILYDIDSDGDQDALYRTEPSSVEFQQGGYAYLNQPYMPRAGELRVRLSSNMSPLDYRKIDVTSSLEPGMDSLPGTSLATGATGTFVILGKSRIGDLDADGRADLMLASAQVTESGVDIVGPGDEHPDAQHGFMHRIRYGFSTVWGESFDHITGSPYDTNDELEEVAFASPVLKGLHVGGAWQWENALPLPSYQRVLADLDGDARPEVIDPMQGETVDLDAKWRADWDYAEDWQDPEEDNHVYKSELTSRPDLGILDFEAQAWSCGNDRALVSDLDGDGRQEALIASEFSDAAPVTGHHTYRALAVSGDAGVAAGTSLLWAGDCATKINPDVVMGDWNGDGLADILYPTGSYIEEIDADEQPVYSTETLVRWNLGNGFGPAEPIGVVGPADAVAGIKQDVPKDRNGDPVPWDRGTRVADVDGDGRSDVIAFREDINKCVYPRIVGLPAGAELPVCENTVYVYRSRGTHFVAEPLFVWQDAGVGATLTHGFTTAQIGDVTGDGSPDIVHVVGGRLSYVEVPWRQTPDLLKAVHDDSAAHPLEIFEYSREWWGEGPRREANTNDPTGPAVCPWPLTCTQQGFNVVRQHRVFAGTREDGTSMYRLQLHTYAAIKRHLLGRGSLGFERHVIWDRELGAQTTRSFRHDYEHDLDGAAKPGAVFYPYVGVPHLEVTYTPRARTASTAELALDTMAPGLTDGPLDVRTRWASSTYELRGDDSKRILTIQPKNTDVSDVENSQHLHASTAFPSYGVGSPFGVGSRTQTVYYFDDFGNQTDELTTVTAGHGPTSTYVTRNIVTEYDTPATFDPPSPRWDRRRPIAVTQQSFDRDDTKRPLRVTRTKYDDRGNVYIEAVRASAPDYESCILTSTPEACEVASSVTEYVRDGRGNVIETIATADDEPDVRRTRTYWDDDGVYPWATTNALGMSTVSVRHPALGVPVVETDANDVSTTMTYDGFARPLGTTPEGGMAVTREYAAYDLNGRRGLDIVTTTAAGGQATTRTDELGRQIEAAHEGFGSTWSRTKVHYDVHGNLERASLPTTGVFQYVTATHDRLGQVLSRKRPGDAATVYAPSLLQTTTTDPLGHVTYVKRDVAGRTIESGHYASNTQTPLGEVTFTYAPFDQIATVTNAEGHTTYRAYDGFGRRTSERDPDTGSTSYKYNGFSEVTSEIRPLGDIQRSYDQLGRVTKIGTPTGATVHVYDTGLGAKGRLARVTSPDAVVTDYTYDAYGRPHGVAQSIASATPDSIYHRYDQHGRLKYLLYPQVGTSRYTIAYDYNANGYLSLVRDATACGVTPDSGPTQLCTVVPLWRVDARNARLQPTEIRWADQMIERRYYDSLGRHTRITAPGKDTRYAYYDDGQLYSRTEGTGQTERFTYDEMHRLTRWDLHTSPADKSIAPKDIVTEYTYDELGNLEQVTRGALITFSATYDHEGRPHAMGWSSATGDNAYDAHGRQYRAGSRTTTFDAFDLPKRIVTGSSTTTLKYDGTGRRAQRVVGTSTKRYLGRLYEARSAFITSHIFHVYGESGPIAQVEWVGSARSTRFVVADPLGSSSVVMRSTGEVDEASFYDPFGTRLNDTGNPTADPHLGTTRGFTGHEEDGGGLIHMQGRMYDAKQYRFISPDPVIGEPLFGQTYNPYSYVYNDPLNRTDPSGFDASGGTVMGGDGMAGGMTGAGVGDMPGGSSSGPMSSEPAPLSMEAPTDVTVIATDAPAPPPPRPVAAAAPPVTPLQPIKMPTPATDDIAKIGRTVFDIKNPLVDQAFQIAVGSLVLHEQGPNIVLQMIQAPLIAADEAGQHYARSQLLAANGADEAVHDEQLAMAESGATAIAAAALAVAGGAGLQNVRQGMAGEAHVRRMIQQLDPKALVIEQLTVSPGVGSWLRTRPDFFVVFSEEVFGARWMFIEVKTGASAGLTWRQALSFPRLRAHGGIVRGNKGADLGLPKDSLVPPTPVHEIYLPWPLPKIGP